MVAAHMKGDNCAIIDMNKVSWDVSFIYMPPVVLFTVDGIREL